MTTNLRNLINQLLEETKMNNGSSIYWLIKDEQINMGDESSLHTMIYQCNRPKNEAEEDEFYEKDGEIMASVEAIIMDPEDGLKLIHQFEGKTIYMNSYGDSIQIHTTDDHIYCLIFCSGQY